MDPFQGIVSKKSLVFISILSLLAIGKGDNRTTPLYRRRLLNQYCEARETLVRVDKIDDKYFPMVVKLHQCDGSCSNHHPSVRKCIASTKQTIAVGVRRMLDRQKQTIYLQNHTSCGCPCLTDKSSCNPQTQTWDERSCKCQCKPHATVNYFKCYKPFEWDAKTCQCQCKLQCNQLQTLDPRRCTCNCKQDSLQQCRLLNKYFNPENCHCFSLREKSTAGVTLNCNGLSSTWMAVLIFMGFMVCITLAFDCVLYAKKTGISFKLSKLCRKREKPQQAEDKNNCIPLTKGEEVEM